jgi:cell division septum initiation protein DivIVA
MALLGRGGENPAGQRNPHLGKQVFGYSRAKTNALLEVAAIRVETLTAELERTRGELAAAEERAARMEAALADVQQLTQHGERPAHERAEQIVRDTHTDAALLYAEAYRIIDEGETRARAIVEAAEVQADALRVEAAELRHLLTSVRRDAAAIPRSAADAA